MKLVKWGILIGLCLTSVQAGQISDWNSAVCDAIRKGSLPPGLASRNLAIVHLSIWDAARTHKEDKQATAAIAAAGHRTCITLFPTEQAQFDELLRSQIESLGKSADLKPGLGTGQEVALARIAERENDGASTLVHYVPSNESGNWRRTRGNRPPETPQWPEVQPFALRSGSQHRPKAPPQLGSAIWKQALQQVRILGEKGSTHRTEEQTEIAHFWSDFSYTSTPPGHWNEVARELIAGREETIAKRAKVLAVLNVALADAGIAAFDSKYHYNFWRPVTALSKERKVKWESLLPAPPHPEYVSGHSTFSGAAAEILAKLLGGDKQAFGVGSESIEGKRRYFSSLQDCAEEVGMSRIYGGIHYAFSNKQGLSLGKSVAQSVWKAFESGSLEPKAMLQ